MNDKVTAVRDVWRYEQGEISKVEDRMVTEFPLTVILNGSEFVTLVCTPEHIEELVIGFLASEGVIRFQKEIKRFTQKYMVYKMQIEANPLLSNPRKQQNLKPR